MFSRSTFVWMVGILGLGTVQAGEFKPHTTRVVEIVSEFKIQGNLETWCNYHQKHTFEKSAPGVQYEFQCRHFKEICEGCKTFTQFLEIGFDTFNMVITSNPIEVSQHYSVVPFLDSNSDLFAISLARIDAKLLPKIVLIDQEDLPIFEEDRSLISKVVLDRMVLNP